MKKIISISVIAVLAISSCAKARTCTCVWTPTSETYNGSSVPVIASNTTTDVETYAKVTKKGANCKNRTQTLTYVSGPNITTLVQTSSCTLK